MPRTPNPIDPADGVASVPGAAVHGPNTKQEEDFQPKIPAFAAGALDK